MLSLDDKKKFRTLIRDTVQMFCKFSLVPKISGEFTVEGLIGITVEEQDLMLVSLSETLHGKDKPPQTTDQHASTSRKRKLTDDSTVPKSSSRDLTTSVPKSSPRDLATSKPSSASGREHGNKEQRKSVDENGNRERSASVGETRNTQRSTSVGENRSKERPTLATESCIPINKVPVSSSDVTDLKSTTSKFAISTGLPHPTHLIYDLSNPIEKKRCKLSSQTGLNNTHNSKTVQCGTTPNTTTNSMNQQCGTTPNTTTNSKNLQCGTTPNTTTANSKTLQCGTTPNTTANNKSLQRRTTTNNTDQDVALKVAEGHFNGKALCTVLAKPEPVSQQTAALERNNIRPRSNLTHEISAVVIGSIPGTQRSNVTLKNNKIVVTASTASSVYTPPATDQHVKLCDQLNVLKSARLTQPTSNAHTSSATSNQSVSLNHTVTPRPICITPISHSASSSVYKSAADNGNCGSTPQQARSMNKPATDNSSCGSTPQQARSVSAQRLSSCSGGINYAAFSAHGSHQEKPTIPITIVPASVSKVLPRIVPALVTRVVPRMGPLCKVKPRGKPLVTVQSEPCHNHKPQSKVLTHRTQSAHSAIITHHSVSSDGNQSNREHLNTAVTVVDNEAASVRHRHVSPIIITPRSQQDPVIRQCNVRLERLDLSSLPLSVYRQLLKKTQSKNIQTKKSKKKRFMQANKKKSYKSSAKTVTAICSNSGSVIDQVNKENVSDSAMSAICANSEIITNNVRTVHEKGVRPSKHFNKSPVASLQEPVVGNQTAIDSIVSQASNPRVNKADVIPPAPPRQTINAGTSQRDLILTEPGATGNSGKPIEARSQSISQKLDDTIPGASNPHIQSLVQEASPRNLNITGSKARKITGFAKLPTTGKGRLFAKVTKDDAGQYFVTLPSTGVIQRPSTSSEARGNTDQPEDLVSRAVTKSAKPIFIDLSEETDLDASGSSERSSPESKRKDDNGNVVVVDCSDARGVGGRTGGAKSGSSA